MAVSLKQYTLRHLIVAILVIITIWASVFYAFILDEVYDNVDDGLRNQKILILRAVYEDDTLLETRDYGVNQFRIFSTTEAQYNEQNVFSNEMYYMPYDDEEEPYRVLRTGFYGPDKKPYLLEIRTSTVERDDLIVDLSIALGVLYLFMMTSIFLLNQYVLTRAWRPFKAILANLHHYQIGQTQRVKPISTDVKEFQQLNEHIDDMVKRNEAVYADQKLFIENASHELQTPLAITINKLELLMEDENLTKHMLIALGETKQSLQRLTALNRSLLTLSRIENRQYIQSEEVNVNVLTNELVGEFADMIAYKGLLLHLNELEDFVLKGNKELMRTALSNLLFNAIKYTKEGGEIVVELQQGYWRIKNTSHIGALPKDYIFNRFYKGESHSNSTGLGLAIVDSIVQSTPDLTISYSFEDNFHIFFLTCRNS